MQTALHQDFAPARVNEFDSPFAAAASLCAASTISTPEMSSPCLRGRSLIFASGPTSIGRIIPASAALDAPRSELSSQGCTTMVGVGGTALGSSRSGGHTLHGCNVSRLRRRLAAIGRTRSFWIMPAPSPESFDLANRDFDVHHRYSARPSSPAFDLRSKAVGSTSGLMKLFPSFESWTQCDLRKRQRPNA